MEPSEAKTPMPGCAGGIVLIGDGGSKRTAFMKKAAESLGFPLRLLDWAAIGSEPDIGRLRGCAVKIDPPPAATASLEQMRAQLSGYIEVLQKLARAECYFFNPPEAILQLLDKKYSKQRLQEHGILATQMFMPEIEDTGQLLDFMRQSRCYGVFIKPRYFSGAAGVAALRIHPVRGEMVLYTSCRVEQGRLINTKKLYQMRDTPDIVRLLGLLLHLECVIERWHPKAEVGKKSYDLRAVYQFGHIAHIVVRCSQGPVTNLHLNNQALELGALRHSVQNMQGMVREVESLCRRAVALFPGLAMAGVDILLEKDTLRPRIIEMNGQGDLIYQDIYGKNKIYREQVEKLGAAAQTGLRE